MSIARPVPFPWRPLAARLVSRLIPALHLVTSRNPLWVWALAQDMAPANHNLLWTTTRGTVLPPKWSSAPVPLIMGAINNSIKKHVLFAAGAWAPSRLVQRRVTGS